MNEMSIGFGFVGLLMMAISLIQIIQDAREKDGESVCFEVRWLLFLLFMVFLNFAAGFGG